jgi:hypothetical protein
VICDTLYVCLWFCGLYLLACWASGGVASGVKLRLTGEGAWKPRKMECSRRRDKGCVDAEDEEKKRKQVEERIKIMGELTAGELLSWLGRRVLCVLMGTFHSVAPLLHRKVQVVAPRIARIATSTKTVVPNAAHFGKARHAAPLLVLMHVSPGLLENTTISGGLLHSQGSNTSVVATY